MAKILKVRNSDNTGWDVVASSIPDVPDISTFATIEYVDDEISNIDLTSTINTASAAAVTYLVDGAPNALNTLNELSAALNDDENFATSVTNSLSNKLDISSASTTYAPINNPVFTGNPEMTYPKINGNAQYNNKIGTEALSSVTTSGSSNIAVGDYSLWSVTSGDRNVAVGTNSQFAVTGRENVSLGHNSLLQAENSSYNVSIGAESLNSLTTGGGNVAIGYGSGSAITTGSGNLVIGGAPGSSIATSNENIIISDGNGNIRAQYLSADNGWTLSTVRSPAFTGTTSIQEIKEDITIINSSIPEVLNYDILNNHAVTYYTQDNNASFNVNFRGNSSTTLGSIMSSGESITIALLVKNGSTGGYANYISVDDQQISYNWLGGSSSLLANPNSTNIYSFTIIKTGNQADSFIIFASQSKFGG